jgi:hypothetical protein
VAFVCFCLYSLQDDQTPGLWFAALFWISIAAYLLRGDVLAILRWAWWLLKWPLIVLGPLLAFVCACWLAGYFIPLSAATIIGAIILAFAINELR